MYICKYTRGFLWKKKWIWRYTRTGLFSLSSLKENKKSYRFWVLLRALRTQTLALHIYITPNCTVTPHLSYCWEQRLSPKFCTFTLQWRHWSFYRLGILKSYARLTNFRNTHKVRERGLDVTCVDAAKTKHPYCKKFKTNGTKQNTK